MLCTFHGFLFFLFFGSAGLFCGLALQQPVNSAKRWFWTALNFLSGVACLKLTGEGKFLFYQPWAAATITITLHTFALLVLERRVLDTRGVPLFGRLRLYFREWLNVRRLELAGDASRTTNRVMFAIVKCARIFLLWTAGQLDVMLATYIGAHLETTVLDLSPDKQGLIPLLTFRHLCLRAHESVRWIVHTYWTLAAAHNFFAIIFVSVLQW